MLVHGYLARGVRIQQHTFTGPPQNDDQKYELTQPECLAMTPKLVGKPIWHWHNRGAAVPGQAPIKIGEIRAAKFDPVTGDWGVSFELTSAAAQGMYEAGQRKAYGLSLSHHPVTLEPNEVSLTLTPARDGCCTVSNELAYNTPVFGKFPTNWGPSLSLFPKP